MRSCNNLKYLFIIVLFAASLAADEISILKIVNPSQEHISEENIASFVVEADSDYVDMVIITNETNETFNIEVNSTRSHYCKSIHLHFGENSINVSGYKGGNLVKQEDRRIFYTSKVHKEYRYPPQKYNQHYFHTDASEKVCLKCHDMSVNEVDGVAFEDITKSNCYQCHSLITAQKHAHAPAVNWLCTSCHNGNVAEFNQQDKEKTKYTVPDPIGTVCFVCHKKHEEIRNEKRFKHEPADSGRCNKCHNPHSSDSEFYLRKPVWELCTGCHKDKIKGMHIVKTFTNVMHPTHNKKDPSRPGKDLSCVSCHNPHASNAPSLLQSSSVFGLCSRCHKK